MSFMHRGKDEVLKDRSELAEYAETLTVRVQKLTGLLSVFENFAGWDAFRNDYLKAIRLRQLESAATKALKEPDAVRDRLVGQIDEISFLITAKDDIQREMANMQRALISTDRKLKTINKKIERMHNG